MKKTIEMALKTMIISNLLLLISCVEYLSSRFEFEGKSSSNFAIQQNILMKDTYNWIYRLEARVAVIQKNTTNIGKIDWTTKWLTKTCEREI